MSVGEDILKEVEIQGNFVRKLKEGKAKEVKKPILNFTVVKPNHICLRMTLKQRLKSCLS